MPQRPKRGRPRHRCRADEAPRWPAAARRAAMQRRFLPRRLLGEATLVALNGRSEKQRQDAHEDVSRRPGWRRRRPPPPPMRRSPAGRTGTTGPPGAPRRARADKVASSVQRNRGRAAIVYGRAGRPAEGAHAAELARRRGPRRKACRAVISAERPGRRFQAADYSTSAPHAAAATAAREARREVRREGGYHEKEVAASRCRSRRYRQQEPAP